MVQTLALVGQNPSRICRRLGGVSVEGRQGAGVLSGLARANGLLVVPEELAVAEPGTVLPAQMIDWDLG